MARGSYYQKFKEQTGFTDDQRRAAFVITPEKRIPFEEGKVLLIDKPLHWTSFDVVRKVRNAIGIKKVGHAGTLDPLATGLLIICTGKFTKRINEMMVKQKTYTGTITLGATTPTYDCESDRENEKDFSAITEQQIKETTKTFTGLIQQRPPVYSAIKKAGERAYELARRGEEVEMEARPVTIHAFNITRVALPLVDFEITCSTGTYIRSIAHDLGQALGCGGFLSALRRTAISEYKVEDGMSLDDFLSALQDQKG